jgi:hypothetical protein
VAKGTPKKPQPPAVVYERYTLRAELAGWAIVLGLAVELGTLIAAGRPLSELIPQAIADVLIGGGVAFELLFGRRARIAGDSAQAEANARAAEAELRLGELQQSVARNAMPRQITSFEAFDNELKDVPPATVEILYESNVTDAFMLD